MAAFRQMSDGGRVYDVKTVRQVASRDVLFRQWVAPTRFVRNQIKSHSEHGREAETDSQRDRQTK